MIRRRCHFIVVSDATADFGRKFTDLGNAIQKIRIDMGVEITVDKDYDDFLYASDVGQVHHRVIICTIDYEHADKGGINGRLIYLKPSINKTEPPDVYTYGRESQTFPHETTADQWFSEAQFECYRTLGEMIAKEIPWDDPPGPPSPPSSEHGQKSRSESPLTATRLGRTGKHGRNAKIP